MVPGLTAVFQYSNILVTIARRFRQHCQEFSRADVISARAGHEDAPGTQHLQGAEIEFLVSAHRGFQRTPAPSKSGWIEDDGVVLASGSGVVLEQVKSIRLDPLDLSPVQRGILLSHLQGGAGTIHPRDL